MSASSMRRTDILSLSGLRPDGRKPHELRRTRMQLGPTVGGCSGSALMEMGLTVALAMVHGPTECLRRTDERSDRAVLQVTVYAAPFAAGADRRVTNAHHDRRLIETAHTIQQALEATVLLHLYPRLRIEIVVSILSDDGSRLCAALNAATLALMDAGIPMKDLCCACTAGYAMNNTAIPLVDLNRIEESVASVPCAILPQRDTLVMVQCDAQLPDAESLERVMEAAQEGCRAVFALMQAAVRERAATLVNAQRGHVTVTQAFTWCVVMYYIDCGVDIKDHMYWNWHWIKMVRNKEAIALYEWELESVWSWTRDEKPYLTFLNLPILSFYSLRTTFLWYWCSHTFSYMAMTKLLRNLDVFFHYEYHAGSYNLWDRQPWHTVGTVNDLTICFSYTSFACILCQSFGSVLCKMSKDEPVGPSFAQMLLKSRTWDCRLQLDVFCFKGMFKSLDCVRNTGCNLASCTSKNQVLEQ
jgi:exosome complex component RRP41